jgi:hypothetical protein
MINYFKRVREIHNNMLNAGKGNYESIPVSVSSKEIVAFGVQCGEKYFVYLYNSQINSIRTDIQLDVKTSFGGGFVDYYDCETGIYHKLQEIKPEANALFFNEFELAGKTDVILIFSR